MRLMKLAVMALALACCGARPGEARRAPSPAVFRVTSPVWLHPYRIYVEAPQPVTVTVHAASPRAVRLSLETEDAQTVALRVGGLTARRFYAVRQRGNTLAVTREGDGRRPGGRVADAAGRIPWTVKVSPLKKAAGTAARPAP